MSSESTFKIRIERTRQPEENESNTTEKEQNSDDLYSKLDADKVVDAYGPYGRYQLFGYCLCQALNFLYAAAVYVMPYVQLAPGLNCTNYEGDSLEVDESCYILGKEKRDEQCGLILNTSLLISETSPVTSLIKEFDLTCHNMFFKEAGLTAFTIGAVVTVPITAKLADSYGRRIVILISLFISVVANIVAAWSTHFWMFLVLRFIIGAASDTYLSICSILTCELVSSKCRAWITLMYTVAWVCGMFWIGILTLFVHEWRWMYFAHAIPGLITILYYFHLPESPHWMILHNKKEKIKKYVQYANRFNNTDIDLDECLRDGPIQDRKESVLAVLRSRIMVKYLCINGLIQFCIALLYFSISLMSVDLSQDKFTAYMLSAAVELPGGFVVVPLMVFFGRRSLTAWSLVVQGISMAIAPFLKMYFADLWISTAVLLFAKMVNSITYSVHPIYATEMVPTSVRSLSFSIINIPQSIGILTAPYFKHLVFQFHKVIPFVAVGFICCLAASLCYLLPETKDNPMPADIKSLEFYPEAGPDEESQELTQNSSDGSVSD